MNGKVLASFFCVLAACSLCFAKQEESLDQLKARADAASPAEQTDLCIQVADRALKLTIDAYKANQPNEGRTSLDEVVKYSDKAHSASIRSGKKIKHTEIKIRRISERLRDLKFNTDVDDQPLVQAAIDKLEEYRTELLKSMFGSKSHD